METIKAIELVAKRNGVDMAVVIGHAHIFAEEVEEIENAEDVDNPKTLDAAGNNEGDRVTFR